MSALPPLFLLTIPEGPPPYNPNFVAKWTADAALGGIHAYVKINLADAYAGNFADFDNAVSVFPSSSLFMVALGALPLSPNAGVTYRTITLPLYTVQLGRVNTVLPVIWDQVGSCVPGSGGSGFQTDMVQAMANFFAHVAAKSLQSRIFAIGFCPNQRLQNDGEFTIPSTNAKNNGGDDFTAEWMAVGYSDANVITACANIAAGIKAVTPAGYASPLWNQFCFLSASQQELGFGTDPNCTLASEIMAAMVAGNSNVTPCQQSFMTNTKASNYAISQGVLYNRLLLQIIPGYTKTPDINAALAAALSFNGTGIVKQIQIHGGQGAAALAFYAQVANSPFLSYGSPKLISVGGKLLSTIPAHA